MAPSSRIRSRRNSVDAEQDTFHISESPLDTAHNGHNGYFDRNKRRQTVAAVTPLTEDEEGRRRDYAAKRSQSTPAKKSRRQRTARKGTSPDSEWDTDYDPLDKYYLSAEDEDRDHSVPTATSSTRHDRSKSSATSEKRHSSEQRHRSSRHHRKHHDSDDEEARHSSHHRRSSRLPGREQEQSRGHSRTHSPRRHRDDSPHRSTRRRSPGRDDDHSHHRRSLERDNSFDRPRRHSTHPSASRGRARPKPVKRSSSFNGRSSRSRTRYPPNASRTTEQLKRDLHEHSTNTAKTMDFPWGQAVQCAVRAGAMTALKVGREPGPWVGMKGGKVISAAMGAAVVDGFMAQRDTPGVRSGGMRHATMRHLTELAISNMVAKPALKNLSGGRGGRRR